MASAKLTHEERKEAADAAFDALDAAKHQGTALRTYLDEKYPGASKAFKEEALARAAEAHESHQRLTRIYTQYEGKTTKSGGRVAGPGRPKGSTKVAGLDTVRSEGNRQADALYAQHAVLIGRLADAEVAGHTKVASKLKAELDESLEKALPVQKRTQGGVRYLVGKLQLNGEDKEAQAQAIRRIAIERVKQKALQHVASPAARLKHDDFEESTFNGLKSDLEKEAVGAREKARKAKVLEAQDSQKKARGLLGRFKDPNKLRTEYAKLGLIYNEEDSEEDQLKVLRSAYKKKADQKEKRRLAFSRESPGTDRFTARLRRRQGPLGAFIGIFFDLNYKARMVAAVALAVGVLFIPSGILAFAGWSIAAAAMVIISGVYSVFVNAIRATVGILLGVINLVFAFFGGLLVGLAELIVGGVAQGHVETCSTGEKSSFCSGREIIAEGLVPPSELNALSIKLLDPSKIQPTASSTPIIVHLVNFLGWEDFSLDFLWGGIMQRFEGWVVDGNIYLVLAAFFVPTALIAWAIYAWFVRPSLKVAGVN